jgi:signal transduction histidine kinase/CheY-like chemotaxis protein
MELHIESTGTEQRIGADRSAAGRQRVLLVVEDAPEDLEVIERQLRRLPDVQYVVRAVPAGLQGIDAVRSGFRDGLRPDCVLLDFHLPDMTALEFLEELAEIEPSSAARELGVVPRLPVPVVVLTGTAQRLEPAVASLQRGAQDYLSKSSITPVTLHRAIEAAVERFESAKLLDEQRQALERQNEALDAAAARTARLLGAATSLAVAATPSAVAQALIDGAVGALAADRGAVALVDRDGASVRVVETDDATSTAGRDASAGATMLESLAESVRSAAPRWTSAAGAPVAIVTVPLIGEAMPVGALGLLFPAPRSIGPEERAFLLTLARLGGQAVERARLYADAQAARREAEDARSRAEQANQAKSQFLAMVSHELRTPLNAIRGYADLIGVGVYGPVTKEQHDALARIRRSEAHLLGLINEMLEFARLEARSPEYRKDPVALADVVTDARAFVEPQLRAKALGFHATCEPGLIALADPDRVRQIVLNLLSNALRFTPPGGQVTLRGAREGNRVTLEVADTGIGIPSDQLERIFEPFVQLGRSLNTPKSGTGLGLAISRDLARGMGGDLTVASETDRGAAFTLSLPRA